MHQVETHGNQGHAQHQVHGTQYEAQLDDGTGAGTVTGTRTGAGIEACTETGAGTGDAVSRHEVTKPDGAQRYEAKVRPVEELPGLPFGEQYGSSGYIPWDKKKKKIQNINSDVKSKKSIDDARSDRKSNSVD